MSIPSIIMCSNCGDYANGIGFCQECGIYTMPDDEIETDDQDYGDEE